MKVGIVGTGMLGNAVALHLLDIGTEVIVFNRTDKKTEQVRDRGASIASSPSEVAKKSELVITIVKDAKAVEEVSFGKQGIIDGRHDGLIVADMSTVDPSESKRISEKFLEQSIKKIDIPVMGGPNVAITGDLVMMVSGDRESFEHCKDMLGKIARSVSYLGSSGVANSIKLAMNLQITMLALALSEGITLVERAGVDPRTFLSVLNNTYFGTGMSKKKAYGMIDGSRDATFTLSNLRKDIGAMTRTAKNLGIKLPMTEMAEEVYDAAIKKDLGDLDYTGIIEYIRSDHNQNSCSQADVD